MYRCAKHSPSETVQLEMMKTVLVVQTAINKSVKVTKYYEIQTHFMFTTEIEF